MKAKKIAVATLGCKVNQYESVTLEESLRGKGFEIVDFSTIADIYIVNTCTVTHKADYQSRQLIRRARKSNPQAEIIATGCYAQVAPQALARMEEVSLIVGNSQKHHIADLIARRTDPTPSTVLVSDMETESSFTDPALHSFGKQTRAFLKIQDGCEAFCSYCVVPYARGKPRSLHPGETLNRLFTLAEAGFKEIVLTGIHLGAYGKDLPPPADLLNLLKVIDAEKPVTRIRLSSLEPMDITDELVEFLSTAETICPHLHLPIQSGDDAVLTRMNRNYRSAEIRRLLTLLADKIPQLCLGADLMVGFPGETDGQFHNTCVLLEELPIAYIHVFSFSPRKKTRAATLPGQIPPTVKEARSRHLRELGSIKKINYYSRYNGTIVQVLIEEKRDRMHHSLRGRSRNYIPVLVEGGDSLKNQEWSVRITRVEGGGVWGSLHSPV